MEEFFFFEEKQLTWNFFESDCSSFGFYFKTRQTSRVMYYYQRWWDVHHEMDIFVSSASRHIDIVYFHNKHVLPS